MFTAIKKVEKPCSICMAEKQVYEGKFNDGLSGNFCWKCAGRMLEARAQNGKDKPPAGDKL